MNSVLPSPTTPGDQSAHAYQYVVLRCVPRVDREEFVNVGVVLYAEAIGYLDARWTLDEHRLGALAGGLDLAGVRAALEFVSGVCRADHRIAGAAAAGTQGTRFGLLKAPRSTVVQPGPVHGGLTHDPDATLLALHDRLVRA